MNNLVTRKLSALATDKTFMRALYVTLFSLAAINLGLFVLFETGNGPFIVAESVKETLISAGQIFILFAIVEYQILQLKRRGGGA